VIDIDNNDWFKCFTFPGGEVGIKWKEGPIYQYPSIPYYFEDNKASLLARINSGNDLVKLLTVTDAFRRVNCKIYLTIPYFPGARQDRVSNFGEPLSVKVYADIINAQNYEKVNILDPHSDVTPALLNNCQITRVDTLIKEICQERGYNTIIIPDAGAAKKTFSYYFPDREFSNKLTFVQCLKKRDTSTGRLSGFRVVDKIPENARCLIVDDICDGGGTFMGLAEEILTGPSSIDQLSLYVTHGIFSKGVEGLLYPTKYGFGAIYTTNSIRDNQPEGVKVYNICDGSWRY
jgi:ribose-phosphate pyrophosphokinase